MKIMWNKKNINKKIIIRACVGCILPNNAILINKGLYILLINGSKIEEPYYDYEIEDIYFDTFITNNYEQLLKYKLIEEENPIKQEDNNPVKKTTVRGYTKKQQ
jgi:hypothetical protein